jgi:clan AA aspartic protease
MMGRVIVTAKLENATDYQLVQRGGLTADQARVVEVSDALVDTGASTLCLPLRLVTQLGLRLSKTRRVRTAGGNKNVEMYEPVRITVQGRDCICEIIGLSDTSPVLIGQVPLELLDFVVDPAGQRLVGNPEHGGEHMLEVF